LPHSGTEPKKAFRGRGPLQQLVRPVHTPAAPPKIRWAFTSTTTRPRHNRPREETDCQGRTTGWPNRRRRQGRLGMPTMSPIFSRWGARTKPPFHETSGQSEAAWSSVALSARTGVSGSPWAAVDGVGVISYTCGFSEPVGNARDTGSVERLVGQRRFRILCSFEVGGLPH